MAELVLARKREKWNQLLLIKLKEEEIWLDVMKMLFVFLDST